MLDFVRCLLLKLFFDLEGDTDICRLLVPWCVDSFLKICAGILLLRTSLESSICLESLDIMDTSFSEMFTMS